MGLYYVNLILCMGAWSDIYTDVRTAQTCMELINMYSYGGCCGHKMSARVT